MSNIIQENIEKLAILLTLSEQGEYDKNKKVATELIDSVLLARHEEIKQKVKDLLKETERARSVMLTASGKNWKKSKKRVVGANIALEEVLSLLSNFK